MSDIKFNCPQCGQHLAVDATGAGTPVACPKCGQAIVVPHLARLARPETSMRMKWWLLATGVVAVALIIGLLVWLTPWGKTTTSHAANSTEMAKPTPMMLYGKQFRFVWKWKNESGTNGIATLHNDGTISGIASDNETFWLIDDEGHLAFKHRDGRVSSIFTHANQRDGKWFFPGPFQFKPGVEHLLEEIGP